LYSDYQPPISTVCSLPSTLKHHVAGSSSLDTEIPVQKSPAFQPVTPVDPDRLEFHLKRIGYDKKKSDFLVNGFRYGFRLNHSGSLSSVIPPNDASVDVHADVVREKIDKELAAGRLKGPFEAPPFQDFHVSPAKVVKKSAPGEFRFIHNLSWPYDESSVNAGIDQDAKAVKYANIQKAMRLIMQFPKGAFTRKTFKIIPIHPDDHHKLGLYIFGKFYYDVTLAMGAASACQIFEAFSTALEAIHMFDFSEPTVHYLDDFFFISPDLATSYLNKSLFDKLCDDIGVPQAPNKVTLPEKSTEFLGIILDSAIWMASLPASKVQSYKSDLEEVLHVRSLKLKDLQSVIGKLSFATSVVPARAFLRRLIDKLSKHTVPHHHVKITKEMKDDLDIWIQFLAEYNGITYFRSLDLFPSPDFEMGADACKRGYGAGFGPHWIQEEFPPEWVYAYTNKVVGISFFEFFPIFVLISMFGHTVKNSNILFHSDNDGVVRIINQQTSKSPNIMRFLRKLVLLLLKFNISLRSKHIPGKKNILYDKISRFQETPALLQRYGMNLVKDDIPSSLQSSNLVDFKKEVSE